MDVKNTKEMVVFLSSLISAGVESVKDDGRITPSDFPKLFSPLKKLMPAIEDAVEIFPELKDLDADEFQELLEAARDQLGFGESEDLEDIMEIIRRGIAIYRRHR